MMLYHAGNLNRWKDQPVQSQGGLFNTGIGNFFGAVGFLILFRTKEDCKRAFPDFEVHSIEVHKEKHRQHIPGYNGGGVR